MKSPDQRMHDRCLTLARAGAIQIICDGIAAGHSATRACNVAAEQWPISHSGWAVVMRCCAAATAAAARQRAADPARLPRSLGSALPPLPRVITTTRATSLFRAPVPNEIGWRRPVRRCRTPSDRPRRCLRGGRMSGDRRWITHVAPHLLTLVGACHRHVKGTWHGRVVSELQRDELCHQSRVCSLQVRLLGKRRRAALCMDRTKMPGIETANGVRAPFTGPKSDGHPVVGLVIAHQVDGLKLYDSSAVSNVARDATRAIQRQMDGTSHASSARQPCIVSAFPQNLPPYP